MSLQSYRSELFKGVDDLVASVIDDPSSKKPVVVSKPHTRALSQSSVGLTECLVVLPTSPSLHSVLYQDSDLRGHTLRSWNAYHKWHRMLGSCPHSPSVVPSARGFAEITGPSIVASCGWYYTLQLQCTRTRWSTDRMNESKASSPLPSLATRCHHSNSCGTTAI